MAVNVENDVRTGANGSALTHFLVPAMDDLHDTFTTLGLNRDIVVTSANSLAVLATPSYLPTLLLYIYPSSHSMPAPAPPLFVNAYPYFVYAKDPFDVTLEDTLLDPGSVAFTDPATDLSYANRAIAVVASPSLKGDRVGVQESETGPG